MSEILSLPSAKEIWDETQRMKMRRTGKLPDPYPGDAGIAAREDEPILWLRQGSDDIVRKKFIPGATVFRVKATPEGGHSFEAVASSGRADLEGDRINPGGWVFPSYLPILAGHERASFPVAKTERIYVSNDRLMIAGVFPPPGSSAKSDEARALVAAGVLRGVSVGFKPLAKPTPNMHGGFDFEKQELHEVSLVSVPANPDALISRVW